MTDSNWIHADPNPAASSAGGLGETTIRWHSDTAETVDIRVGTPDGTLFHGGSTSGHAATGPWLRDGTTFFLQDVSGGRPLTEAGTLATVTVSVPSRPVAGDRPRARTGPRSWLPPALRHRLNGKRYYDDRAERVFCISMQRTGTTSVGRFFRDFGFDWAGWPADQANGWSAAWYDGDHERIFSSEAFRSSNAFEDSPWFSPDFYKVLFHRFPRSKFVLFVREPDAWFRSMLGHSGGDVIGDTASHCKVYRREPEYFDLLARGAIDRALEDRPFGPKTMKLTGHADHYKEIYRLHAVEVRDYFDRHSPDSLFSGRLEDPGKWTKLGRFLGIAVPEGYEAHENPSPR